MLNLRRNALASIAETIATAGGLFALYKLMMVHLTVADIGIWSLVGAATMIVRLADLGVGDSLTRFVATDRAREAPEGIETLIETSLISVLAAYGLLALVLYLPAQVLLTRLLEPRDATAARELLPYALASFVLVNANGVLLSAIAGLQMSHVRSGLVVASLAVLLGAAALLLPVAGLRAVAWAQAAQAGFLLIAGWLVLRPALPRLGLMPRRWHGGSLRRVVGYGLQLQLASLASLFFEPLAKMIMARCGGVEMVALYEIASRLVVQVRNIAVAAARTLIPAFADLAERDRRGLVLLFDRARRYAVRAAVAVAVAPSLAGPILAYGLGIDASRQFMAIVVVLAAGWALNTCIVPTYYLLLATGEARYNSLSHLITALVAPIAGVGLGLPFGGIGVVIGAMAGLSAGTLFLAWVQHRRFGAGAEFPTRPAAPGRLAAEAPGEQR